MEAVATEFDTFEAADFHNAKQMAQRLARYITCPSTIRAHVVNSFGQGPSLEYIKEAQRKHREARPIWNDVDEPRPQDAKVFDARINQPKRPRPAPVSDVKRIPAALVPINPELLAKGLRNASPATQIREAVALGFGTNVKDMLSESRTKVHVAARAVVAQLLHERNPEVYSLNRIAREIGRGDHSTVHNLLDTFEVRCKHYPLMAAVYEAVRGHDAA